MGDDFLTFDLGNGYYYDKDKVFVRYKLPDAFRNKKTNICIVGLREYTNTDSDTGEVTTRMMSTYTLNSLMCYNSNTELERVKYGYLDEAICIPASVYEETYVGKYRLYIRQLNEYTNESEQSFANTDLEVFFRVIDGYLYVATGMCCIQKNMNYEDIGDNSKYKFCYYNATQSYRDTSVNYIYYRHSFPALYPYSTPKLYGMLFT